DGVIILLDCIVVLSGNGTRNDHVSHPPISRVAYATSGCYLPHTGFRRPVPRTALRRDQGSGGATSPTSCFPRSRSSSDLQAGAMSARARAWARVAGRKPSFEPQSKVGRGNSRP